MFFIKNLLILSICPDVEFPEICINLGNILIRNIDKMGGLKDYLKEASLVLNTAKKKEIKLKPESDLLFIENLDQVINELKNLDSEQRTLNIKLRSKTAQIDEKIDELNKYLTEAKRIIKQ